MLAWNHVVRRMDWLLLFAGFGLAAISLLVLYGMGLSHDAVHYFQFQKQFLAVVIGVALIAVLVQVDYRRIYAWRMVWYVVGCAMLWLALIFGMSLRYGGKWFHLGALSFQPVELAKVTCVIFLAGYFAKQTYRRLSWTTFIGSGIAVAGYLIPILLQPDFGSAMTLFGAWFLLCLFCGLPRHAWWMLALTAVVGGTLLWTVGFQPYQRQRLLTFIHPSSDPRGSSYNVRQAWIAIGSGGWLGKGIGEGSQARLRYLPEASTDFVFAVIGEEMGFLGVSIVCGFFALLFYRLGRLGKHVPDAFAGYCLVGFASIIGIHLFVNAGMNLGLVPVTGIPLPFLSAAASSLVTMFLMLAIAQSMAVYGRTTLPAWNEAFQVEETSVL